MSLIALKFIYIDLVDHFVERDSIALRAAQSEFERILVSASKVASSYRPMDMTQQQTFNIFIDQLDLVADSVKVILLSEQTRQRFMGGIGTDNLDDPSILATYDEEFADLLSHLSKAKKNLANSDGVLSYISGKAQLGDHNIDVTPQPFIAKEIFSYLKNEGGLDDFSLLGVNYHRGDLAATFYDQKLNSQKIFITLDHLSVEKIKEDISSQGSVSKATLELACNTFEPFFSVLPEIGVSDVNILPSVNLFPIPFELVTGAYCNLKDHNLIVVSSLHAALDFYAYISKAKRPVDFVGIGNPQRQVDGFELALSVEDAVRGGI